VHDPPEKAGQISVFAVTELCDFRYSTKLLVKRPDDRRYGFPVQHIDGSQIASFIDLRGLGLRELRTGQQLNLNDPRNSAAGPLWWIEHRGILYWQTPKHRILGF
jgi:hypothetical protein